MFKESDILDIEFRKKVIKDIHSNENHARKLEHFKRNEVYHDKVAKYTEQLLGKQFDKSTIEEMKISLTNVSLCKKIIDKLARVYSHGVERVLKLKRSQSGFDFLIKHLKFNSKMKKANRYLKLHNNVWVLCLPKAVRDAFGGILGYDLKLSVVPPYLFDVIEDSDDREVAKCLVLSNFDPGNNIITSYSDERNGKRGPSGDRDSVINNFSSGDGVDQAIADSGLDRAKHFIWWTDSFHFVTDIRGDIIGGPDDLVNPIGVIPGVSLNKDQDGEYYSTGGNDLVDSCILANAMMTNINHIGIQQGYGQAWMSGKNLPQQVRLGPTKIIKLEQSSENETPNFGYATANAPLNELKELTVTQIALLLSTNNLSTKGIKVNLDSGMDFPSGVAAMIDQSESTEDVKDQYQLFLDSEPSLFRVISKWLDVYSSRDLLVDDLKGIEFLVDDLSISINEPKYIQSESEKLDNLKKRKDLGLNTMVELIKIDNPSLTDAEAEAKLLKITEEKQKMMLDAQSNMMSQGGEDEEIDDNEDDNDKEFVK